MTDIKMVDLSGQYQAIKGEVDQAIQQVIDHTGFIKGPEVGLFEAELADYLSCQAVIACGNGTDALQLALMSLGLRPGDEVITPSFTFVATAEVIALLGLRPVFVDVEPDTFCISAKAIAQAIGPRTKAIIPVHLFGQCANMEPILQLANEHHIYVIEDAAQALGASYTFADGSKHMAGTMGHLGCTSFFPSKNLGCFGDGGAVFTNHLELAQQVRAMANHGTRQKYHHEFVGINSRLDTLQAAVLRVKLPHLDRYNALRQEAAAFYTERFKANTALRCPGLQKGSTHVYHQYTLLTQGVDRDALQNELKTVGMPSMVYYPVPLHLQAAYAYLGYRKGDLPNSELLAERVISLPMHTELDLPQLEFITATVDSQIQNHLIPKD